MNVKSDTGSALRSDFNATEMSQIEHALFMGMMTLAVAFDLPHDFPSFESAGVTSEEAAQEAVAKINEALELITVEGAWAAKHKPN